MKFGIFGSAQAKRGGPDTDSGAGFRDFVELNVEAEALGFVSSFLVEHHFTGFGQVSATLNLLTWVGARTTTLRLGTAVIVLPWHNPVLLAEQAATIDLLSDGRLDFGIGKGYRHNEFAGFCIPMEESDGRIAIFKREVKARGRIFDPMTVAVTRSVHVVMTAAEKEKAVEVRMAARRRTERLAQRPDGQNKASIMSYAMTPEAAEE